MSNPHRDFAYNPRQRTQADKRRNFNVTDQHGRKWLVTLDIEAQDWVAAPIPCFDDTLRTPLKYLKPVAEDPRALFIDYDEWLRDRDQRQQEWDDHRINVSRALYGDRAEIDREPGREVLAIIGPAPQAADRIRAAQAGDVPGLPTAPPAKKAKAAG